MWIVRIALRRPLTFIVLALLIFGIGPLTISRTPTDIFPDINIPVLAVIWNYGGLSADEMSNRISSIFERLVTTAVNDVEHVEAQSLRGTAVVKIFFQPGAKIDLAVAQVGGILLMGQVEDYQSKVVYFMSLDNVKFRRPVKPGDQLHFELDMIQIRGPVCKMRGVARVDGEVVCEADMAAMVRDR